MRSPTETGTPEARSRPPAHPGWARRDPPRAASPAAPAAPRPAAAPASRPPVVAPPAGPLFAWLAPPARLEALAAVAWALPAVLALALALRLAHLVALEHSPFGEALVLDARYYDAWAKQIAAGTWVATSPFWVDPLYAYVLAVIYAVAGHNLLLPRILNLVLGVATAALVARLAQRTWQSRLAALIAALLAITCIPMLYFEGQLEKTALTVVLITGAAELFLAGSRRAVAAAGVVTGFAVLARGNALLFVPVAALCLWLGWDREPGDIAAATPRQRRGRAAVFIAGVLPVIALATWHNWLATHEFVPTTTNLGINLYLGNHAGNPYGYYTPPPFVRPDTGAELPDFHTETQKRTGRAMSDAELSTYWRQQTWEVVESDPGAAALRILHKLQLALHNDEVPDNEDVRMVGEWSPVLRAPIVWFGQLYPLAVLGVVIGWRRRPVRILAAMSLIYLFSLLPFFVMARLRVQLVPLLAVLAAGAVVWLIAAVQARDGRRLGAAAAVIAPLLVVAFYRTDWMAFRQSASLAIAWNNLGSTFAGTGNNDEAIRAYERAVAINEMAVPASLRSLAELHRSRGELPQAEAALRRLLELRPGNRGATEALRSLYAAMLQDPRWRDDAQLRARAQALNGQPLAAAPAAADPARAAVAQARALGSQQRFDEAIRVLEDAVRTGPYDEDLHYMLGQNLDRHGTPEETIRFFSEEVGRDQKPQTSHYFWARGLARQGDIDGAVAHLQQALQIDPAHEMSQREWGALLEQQGKPAEALDHYVEATRIHPDFRAAFEDAARVADQLGRTDDAESYRRRAASADPNTIRRFVHWARYLHEHGRNEAAWAEIQRMLNERPNDPEALQLRDQIRVALGGVVPTAPPAAAPAPAAAASGPLPAQLSGSARTALVGRLASQPSGATWIAYDARDAGAQRLASDLASAFQEAHWEVRSLGPAEFPARPGLFLLVGDDQPSEAARAVDDGLQRAGLTHSFGTGYRQYSEERRRADANWRGVQLAAGQEFIIVVGRLQ
jgi:tetratricopeptide (TPR) repeat protein/4-amino-4-deoxy-L-arabinose transferase-like glycosyltransferase